MQEETKPLGYLFETIAFYNQSDVIKFVNELTKEQSFYVLTQAIQMAYSKNIYSLQESEIISKAIRTLTTPEPEQNEITE